MIKNFIKTINKNQKILISYSGGLDSTVLLYKLIPYIKKYPFLKIRAIHINHQKNISSNEWSIHCKQVCKKNNIPIIIHKIHIHKKNNFQYNARKIRYQIIQQYMLPTEILTTGHHLNDQIETFFLALKRGSGSLGACGIKKTNVLQNEQIIIRPLLTYSKKKIKQWAISNNIKWIEDNSNHNNKYERNFIRNKIIKFIQKKWPYFNKNCARSMKLCHDQEKSINYFIDTILDKNTKYKDCIKISTIKKFKKNIQILLIRRWISLYSKNIISYQDTKNIYNHITKYKTNKQYTINLKNHQIRYYKNQIFQTNRYKNLKNTILFWHNCNNPLTLPEELGIIEINTFGLRIPKPKKTDLINIRFQCKKKILIHAKYKKSIKNIWQENKILPWIRNRIPLLFYNNTLICIIGIINTFTKHKGKNYWHISWINHYLK